MATATMTGTRQKMFSARRFIGKDVFDVKGEHVGEVEDLVLDVDTACAKWSVLSAGGMLGIGGRDYLVPIQTISIEQDSGRLMLSFEEGRLRNAPLYDKDNPPDWGDESWMRSLYAYYGMEQQATGAMQQGGQGSWEQGWQQGYREGTGETYRQTYSGTGQQGGYQGAERRHEGTMRYEGPERRMRHQGGTQGGMQQPLGSHQGMRQQGGQGYGGGMQQGSGQDTQTRQSGQGDWTKRG